MKAINDIIDDLEEERDIELSYIIAELKETVLAFADVERRDAGQHVFRAIYASVRASTLAYAADKMSEALSEDERRRRALRKDMDGRQ